MIKDLSIRGKLVVVQLFVASIVLLLYAVFHVIHDARTHRESIDATLSSTAQLIAFNCTAALNFLDPSAARATLSSLEAQTQVTHAWVIDADGDLFAGFARRGETDLKPPLTTEEERPTVVSSSSGSRSSRTARRSAGSSSATTWTSTGASSCTTTPWPRERWAPAWSSRWAWPW